MVNEKSQIESLRVLEITGKLVRSAVPKVFLFHPVGKCWERWQEGHTGLRGSPSLKQEVPHKEPSPPAAPRSDGLLTFSVSSQNLFPWLTEEVPAQQYLEIDEVTTDSFRVTWHPLSAEEGQHKLMWIPVYGGKTEEVSGGEQTENSSRAFCLEVKAQRCVGVGLPLKID